ncbi:MAG: YdjY domain-containing protein, partial [Planctomycetota bacterium]|nr:YdjY domain-containing protein [Planctomycetota bacterium]
AFICAGFKKGRAFSWDQKTGEVFPPKGEVVHIYAEWKDEKGNTQLASMCEWLWNFKTLDVMQPGKFVYTGSTMIDEGPPHHKKWFGAEVDGLLVAVMNTGTALVDNIEEGAEENGAYEAIPVRIPPIGTRVTIVFSKQKLPNARKHAPLQLPKEVLEERKRRAAEKNKAAKAKPDDDKNGTGVSKGLDKDK